MQRCVIAIRVGMLLAGTWVAVGCWDAGRATNATAIDPGVPVAPPIERAELKLKLRVGERFPLRKVVEQQIVQSLPEMAGQPADTTVSRLEMLLGITVEAMDKTGTRLGVRYDRVRFSRNNRGENLEYDSDRPPVALPLELAAYQGMVGHGFSFWLGAENRIARVAGFAAFVQAALAMVPPESRQDVLLGVEAGTGEDGVVDFVDDTLGLLPFDGTKAAGDTWRHTQRMARPVPMHIDTLCTLRDLTPELAVIDVRGDVTPMVSSGVRTVAHEAVHVVVERGRTVGECTLFRDTGLPKESRIVQEIDLAIRSPGQPAMQQHKRVTTTIESFPTVK